MIIDLKKVFSGDIHVTAEDVLMKEISEANKYLDDGKKLAVLDTATTGIIVLVTLFFMLGVGVHIGVALGLCGIIGTFLAIGRTRPGLI